MKSVLVAGALALFASSAAHAGDRDYLSGMPAYDWTGFYAGVHAGGGIGNTVVNSGTWNSHEVSGGVAGVQAGYRVQYDRAVLGVEASLTALGLSGVHACTVPGFTCIGNYQGLATAEAFLGMSFGNTVIFAKGGAAYLWADADVNPTYPGYAGSTWGYTVGVGVEHAMTEQVSLRLDYSYLDFAAMTSPAGTLAIASQTLEPSAHLVKIGVNFKF